MNKNPKGVISGLLAGLFIGYIIFHYGFEKYYFLLFFLPGFVAGILCTIVDRNNKNAIISGIAVYTMPLVFMFIEMTLEDVGIMKGCGGSGSCSDVGGMILLFWLVGGIFNILASFLVGKIVNKLNNTASTG